MTRCGAPSARELSAVMTRDLRCARARPTAPMPSAGTRPIRSWAAQCRQSDDSADRTAGCARDPKGLHARARHRDRYAAEHLYELLAGRVLSGIMAHYP